MPVECEKKLKFIITEYDSDDLLEVCELARRVVGKGEVPVDMNISRIDRFVTKVFEAED